MPESLTDLESLSVTLQYLDSVAASSLAKVLVTWHPADLDVFTRTIPQLTNITCLRLEFCWRFFHNDPSPPAPCVIPQVTAFFFKRHVVGLIFLPQLRHLVLEYLESAGAEEEDVALMHLLEGSSCVLTSLEIRDHTSTTFPSLLLLHDSIAPSLTRLLISTRDLDNFFTALEAAELNTLPEDIRLLRSVDRCFHLHRTDFFPEDEGGQTHAVKKHVID
ncbi:hypothetical protein B0H14DRAFT_3431641 [Mycena olivaceomarginata]|nr:hypothetical protein B0H14DRAFT_3431641 [Mycena olivaceomarginata]